jgi:hypothetical protein
MTTLFFTENLLPEHDKSILKRQKLVLGASSSKISKNLSLALKTGSRNFRTLAFKREAVDVTQIYPTTATVATAAQRRVTDGKKVIAQIMLLSHKKS